MRRYALKIICLFIVFLAVALNARADAYRHPQTGILFPEAVGAVKLIDVKDYEKEYPGLGVGIMYRTNTFKVDVFVYDMGKPSIPAGITSPAIAEQFEQARGDVYELEKRGVYQDVVTLIPKETIQIRDFPFLHSKMTYTQDNIKRVSHLYLAGYKGQFVKVRITYFLDDSANGEKSLDAFLNVLGSNLKDASK
jgi:hypothetical protein